MKRRSITFYTRSKQHEPGRAVQIPIVGDLQGQSDVLIVSCSIGNQNYVRWVASRMHRFGIEVWVCELWGTWRIMTNSIGDSYSHYYTAGKVHGIIQALRPPRRLRPVWPKRTKGHPSSECEGAYLRAE